MPASMPDVAAARTGRPRRGTREGREGRDGVRIAPFVSNLGLGRPGPVPHWEQPPADLPGAIRQVKDALRARIAASGRTVEDVFSVVEQRLTAEADEIAAARQRDEAPGPGLAVPGPHPLLVLPSLFAIV